MPDVTFDDIGHELQAIRDALGSLKSITDQLNTARSIVGIVLNNTSTKLTRTFDQHDSGGFAVIPPLEIEPGKAGAFGSQSSSGALFTGTVGSVHYAADGFVFKCDWNNPWAGSNSAEGVIDDNSGRYRGWAVAGAGDQHAEMQFALTQVPEQQNWRYCEKCFALFYDGFPDRKGRCPAPPPLGREYRNPPGHSAQGYMFRLAFEAPLASPQPEQQDAWRFCEKCNVLFFDGGTDWKGVCPVGGGHQAQGLMFFLSHDVPPIGNQQPAWRYCEKCAGMFFDGFNDKGHCPRGGPHIPQSGSYLFNLNYQ